ncbi:poly(A) RNA polymerase, mitochondrial isoform X2 [Bacillus rossius redtenbacheri]
MLECRRREAARSILVQVNSELSCGDLHAHCSKYGSVKGLHHYTTADPAKQHFVVVEFLHTDAVRQAMLASCHVDPSQVIPVQSPFLWFRAKERPRRKGSPPSTETVPLVETNGNSPLPPAKLRDDILATSSISEQMGVLHRETCLGDLGLRLRFLTALQLELALAGPFPRVRVLPFGSSVSGFGKTGCDLDLVMLLGPQGDEGAGGRLVFQAKKALVSGRAQAQRHMEVIGDLCHLFLPGCAHVKRILLARIPIVKYRQELTGVDCDLSMSNMSAVHMGELLYVLGRADERVRPLVFALRHWAHEVGLTNPTPGPWITNFSLILLVVFFLQRQAVLPSFKDLIVRAGPEDKRVTADGVNCTFVRDISKVVAATSGTRNTDTLEELLSQFFEFYSSFDFQTRAISIVEGMSISKPEHSALYIVNPLEPYLNVSKNVSVAEMERLRIELRNAAWLLEMDVRQPRHDGKSWGLAALFEAAQLSARGKNIFFTSAASRSTRRLVDVGDLFRSEEAGDVSERTMPDKQTAAVMSTKAEGSTHEQDLETSKESVKWKRR